MNEKSYIPLMDHRNKKDVQIGKIELPRNDEYLLGYMIANGFKFEIGINLQ